MIEFMPEEEKLLDEVRASILREACKDAQDRQDEISKAFAQAEQEELASITLPHLNSHRAPRGGV